MENIDIEKIISLVQELSIPAAMVVIVIVLWKAGFLGALASRIRIVPITGKDPRTDTLMQFKQAAEENHFTDLEKLKEEVRDIWKELSRLAQAVARIEGRLNGNKNP